MVSKDDHSIVAAPRLLLVLSSIFSSGELRYIKLVHQVFGDSIDCAALWGFSIRLLLQVFTV